MGWGHSECFCKSCWTRMARQAKKKEKRLRQKRLRKQQKRMISKNKGSQLKRKISDSRRRQTCSSGPQSKRDVGRVQSVQSNSRRCQDLQTNFGRRRKEVAPRQSRGLRRKQNPTSTPNRFSNHKSMTKCHRGSRSYFGRKEPMNNQQYRGTFQSNLNFHRSGTPDSDC